MPQIYRLIRDFQFGTLTSSITSSATSITNAQFSALPAFTTGDAYFPIVLMDLTTKLYEVIWVTDHASNSTTITVQRGKEGSTARAWNSGTVWQHGPTAWDGLAEKGSVASPYVGQRALDGGAGRVEEYTYINGWQPSVGAAKSTQVGLAANGATMDGFRTLEIRCGTVTVTTNGTGFATITLPSAFPSNHAGGVLISADENLFIGSLAWLAPTTTTFQLCARHPGGAVAASISIKVNYWCWGW